MKVPDLLYNVAPRREPKHGLREALTFGFARGVEEDRLRVLCAPPLKDSYFRKESFAADLFLDQLVQTGFALDVGGRRLDSSHQYFLQVLVAPPKEREDVSLRQGIVSELAREPERLALLERAFLSLVAFRDSLCGSSHFTAKTVGVRRRIDILLSLKRAINDLMTATSSSVSGLQRVATCIEGFKEEESYKRLEQLLDFEDGRTVLETRLRVGYDGDLRSFEIVGTKQLRQAPFPSGQLSRFFRRVISLLKGYRFSEEDVMSQLLDQVYTGLEEEIAGLIGLSLHLEFYLRALGFRRACSERGLAVCIPELSRAGSTSEPRRLRQLFNPWLAMAGVKVVPCDLDQAQARVTTIVTGPNSGGKTRLMQSLAVTQVLAQAGLFVPAAEAQIPEVEQLFLSLLEHADAQQSEGRLGVELVRIREVFENSGPRALVIMDELCSGTNPSEGEKIFDMVLGLFQELGPQVLITTHFLDFAARLAGDKRARLEFMQVEIGERDLPTYQFVPGVAETSLARNTAARLGVTREELLGLIEAQKRPSQS